LPSKSETEEFVPLGVFTVSDDIPKLVTDGGRPTLNYVKEEEEVTTDLTYASKEDLKALTELVTDVASKTGENTFSVKEIWTALEKVVQRLSVAEELLASATVKVKAAKGPLRRDFLAELRQEILDFLKPFGPSVKFPLAFITSNLYNPEDSRPVVSSSYMNQLKKLVADGLVVQHKDANDKSGAKTLYSLAPSEGA